MDISININKYPPEGFELVPGRCPNEGMPCHCIGLCAPRFEYVGETKYPPLDIDVPEVDTY